MRPHQQGGLDLRAPPFSALFFLLSVTQNSLWQAAYVGSAVANVSRGAEGGRLRVGEGPWVGGSCGERMGCSEGLGAEGVETEQHPRRGHDRQGQRRKQFRDRSVGAMPDRVTGIDGWPDLRQEDFPSPPHCRPGLWVSPGLTWRMPGSLV